LVALLGFAACANPSAEPSSGRAASTASVDPSKSKYVALVNGFWDDHVTATSGALQVCIGLGSGTQGVNPPLCGRHGQAMLSVQAKFLSDLSTVAAPTEFAAEDRTFRTQLPTANADLKSMISAADGGNAVAIQNAANLYILDMQPVLEALDQINPAVQHS